MTEVVERTEVLTPEPAIALAGLLDVPLPDVGAGEGLPLTWHWVYLLERPLQQDLGPDGHPVRNVVPAPPGPGLRRTWAGGRVRSLAPLRVGEPATRRSRVLGTTEKQGRSGLLTFVTVGHTVLQRGEVVVQERQDILYRDAAVTGPPVPAGGQEAEPEEGAAGTRGRLAVGPGEWALPVSPTMLFRFSALTYNAHRIHYDRDYARSREGYPGLVVHGPLQAMAMAEVVRARSGTAPPAQTLSYRLVAPLLEGQGLVVQAQEHDPDHDQDQGSGLRTSVRDHWGRRTAEGLVS